MPLERLQKIIAAAGICSRRAAEELITAGRVRVNGPAVTELGAKADAETDEILVDGKPLRRSTPHVYILLNKPRGCVTTVEDPEGRPTVMEFLKRIRERIYPVGRLDFHSEGLLLFTNDGEFANRILSTGFGVNKTYWAKVHGTPAPAELDRLREGVMMDGRRTLPAEIRPLPQQGGEDWRDEGRRRKPAAKSRKPRHVAEDEDAGEDGNPWYEVVLQEGRQNQIRRMFDLIGHPVRKLRRVRIGRLTLGTLKPGEFRHLEPEEVEALMAGERASEGNARKAAPRKRRTAADFRKSFQRGAEESGPAAPPEELAVPPDENAVIAEEVVREPAAVVSEEPASASSVAGKAAGFPLDDLEMELAEEGGEEPAPAQPFRPRRPFERRPEPAPQPRFNERPQYGRKKFPPAPGERRPFEKRPHPGQRPEQREFAGGGERRPFERAGGKREGFKPRGPAGAAFDRERPARGGFPGKGAARGGFAPQGPRREEFDRQGPPRGGFKRGGPPRGEYPPQRGRFEQRPFERAGGEREAFERKGPDRGGFQRGGFPRDTFPPEKYASAGPPRETGRPPREKGQRPFRPRQARERPFSPRPPRSMGPAGPRGPREDAQPRFGRGTEQRGHGDRPPRGDRPPMGERPMRPRSGPPRGTGRSHDDRPQESRHRDDRPAGSRPFERRPFAPRSFDDRGPKGPPRAARPFSDRAGSESRPPRRPTGAPGRPPAKGRPAPSAPRRRTPRE